MTEFLVLGPVEVWADGRRADAGQPRQRAVLAALLADAGRPVPVDTLIDRVWGQAPPKAARPSLHAHITRIRQMLPGGDVVFEAGCYRLEVDPGRVDLHRFRQLTAQAREPRSSERLRAELLREAVGLWRGEPLAGLSGPWVTQSRLAWRQEFLAAAMAWAEAELRVKNPGAVVALLSELAAEHPLTESLAVVLMRALAAAGRPAEALAHYETVRRHLVAELGTDPSPELQAAYQAILLGDTAKPERTALAQLPADLPGFAGRAEHLAQLDTGDGQRIFTVSGTAGVGKTTLAVHWAHSVAHRFPDGQLYVNLRGYDAPGRMVDPADALRGFLDALGADPARIPSGVDAQSALYRSLLSGRRILVLLDNARDGEQVRPLLPATPGAVAVVTSRNRLTGLIAAEGARSVALDVLTEDEARDLLARRLGADRTAAEPEAVREIIAACARLPLALAVAAAHAGQTSFPLAAVAADITGSGDRLDALDTGDPAVQVRAIFSWSYAALSPAAARLFRLLGRHPGPDFSVAAAAALSGEDLSRTRRQLAELANATLLVEHSPGRFTCHDLLRAYAAELAGPAEDAVARLVDHYLHTAYAAGALIFPARDGIELPLAPPAPGSRPEILSDHPAAMAWFDREHQVLLAIGRLATDTALWQLTWSTDTFLYRRGHWHDRAAQWEAAIPAADRLDDFDVRAYAHRTLARTYISLGRTDEAADHLSRTLDLSIRSGNRAGQANAHNTLAFLGNTSNNNREALEHSRQAVALYEEVGNLRGLAAALSNMGWTSDLLGEYEAAILYCTRALEVLEKVGDRRAEADVWDSLGYAHHHLGRHAEAAKSYEQALIRVREESDRYAESEILVHLGDTASASGDQEAAAAAWNTALDILVDLDHTDAENVRAKLEALGGPQGQTWR